MQTVNDREFGIEFEFLADREGILESLRSAGIRVSEASYGNSHSPREATWILTTDGSIEPGPTGLLGLELKSPILSGSEGLSAVKKAADAIKAAGAKVNPSCGLHIHHSAEGIALSHLKVLVCKFMNHEGFMATLQPSIRFRSRYAQSVRARFGSLPMPAIYKAINAAADRNALAAMMGGKYQTLNYESLSAHGTIEFRGHAGSVQSADAIAWILLTQAMIQDAIDFKTIVTNARKMDDAGSFFRVVPEGMRAQIRKFYETRADAIVQAEAAARR